MADKLWPRKCPNCGEPTTESGTWYNPEPYKPYTDSDEILLPGQCWSCDYMHPWFLAARKALAEVTPEGVGRPVNCARCGKTHPWRPRTGFLCEPCEAVLEEEFGTPEGGE